MWDSYKERKEDIFYLQNNSVHLYEEEEQLCEGRFIASQPKVLFRYNDLPLLT